MKRVVLLVVLHLPGWTPSDPDSGNVLCLTEHISHMARIMEPYCASRRCSCGYGCFSLWSNQWQVRSSIPHAQGRDSSHHSLSLLRFWLCVWRWSSASSDWSTIKRVMLLVVRSTSPGLDAPGSRLWKFAWRNAFPRWLCRGAVPCFTLHGMTLVQQAISDLVVIWALTDVFWTFYDIEPRSCDTQINLRSNGQ